MPTWRSLFRRYRGRRAALTRQISLGNVPRQPPVATVPLPPAGYLAPPASPLPWQIDNRWDRGLSPSPTPLPPLSPLPSSLSPLPLPPPATVLPAVEYYPEGDREALLAAINVFVGWTLGSWEFSVWVLRNPWLRSVIFGVPSVMALRVLLCHDDPVPGSFHAASRPLLRFLRLVPERPVLAVRLWRRFGRLLVRLNLRAPDASWLLRLWWAVLRTFPRLRVVVDRLGLTPPLGDPIPVRVVREFRRLLVLTFGLDSV